jgi:hypothetical protein
MSKVMSLIIVKTDERNVTKCHPCPSHLPLWSALNLLQEDNRLTHLDFTYTLLSIFHMVFIPSKPHF